MYQILKIHFEIGVFISRPQRWFKRADLVLPVRRVSSSFELKTDRSEHKSTHTVSTHRCEAKVMGCIAWLALWSWIGAVVYGIVAYLAADILFPWSPQYSEREQFETMLSINKRLATVRDYGLMLNRTRNIPAPIDGLGHAWWPFILSVGMILTCLSLCIVPPQRKITLDRELDRWWVEITRWGYAEYCFRCDWTKYGKSKMESGGKISNTYLDMSPENHSFSLKGCGVTKKKEAIDKDHANDNNASYKNENEAIIKK